jgi:catechol-2,3-dioxygenase
MAGAISPIAALKAVEFNVADISRSTAFYRDIWGLDPVGEVDGARAFRASGPDYQVLTLKASPTSEIGATEWTVASRVELEQLSNRLCARYPVVRERTAFNGLGGGYGFSIRDRFDRLWRFSTEVATHGDGAQSLDRPYKLSHVVLNSPDIAADVSFAIEELGFRLRDESKSMIFLGCNSDHHSLAFTRVPSVTLNHVAFEVPSIDAVMRNAGRLKKNGIAMQWGVGRHGPGANVYSYFVDPDELAIEYTAEIQQVDDATHRPGSPAEWERPPFWDAWGLAEPPTELFRNATAGIRGSTLAAKT